MQALIAGGVIASYKECKVSFAKQGGTADFIFVLNLFIRGEFFYPERRQKR